MYSIYPNDRGYLKNFIIWCWRKRSRIFRKKCSKKQRYSMASYFINSTI